MVNSDVWHSSWQVFGHRGMGLGLPFVWFDSYGLPTDVIVVHLLHALFSFLLVVEIKEAVALKLKLLVKRYLSGLQLVALICENLIKV